MVEPFGIHLARVEPDKGQVIETENAINVEKKKGKFIGNEYVITEKYQILPLYGLTLKRNEYFVIWRDPHFSGKNEFSDYLKSAKMYLYKNENINVYIESTTEKALELIKKKKFNKIILIRFVEIARKILGFDVMVLFFSANNDHLKWIQNFPNALYTNNSKFYQYYVKNYNKKGLEILKKDIENAYKIKLQFTDNFLEFPKFINSKKYNDIIFDEISPYFRKIIIKSPKYESFLKMNKDASLEFVGQKEVEDYIWYITIINGEITLFSNNLYLSFNIENKEATGYQFMIVWNIEENNGKQTIYYKNKNNILTIEGNKAIVSNQSNNSAQSFSFIDID